MINIELIKAKLPQELWEKAEKFTIPDEFLTTMPDLIVLVLNSKSMDAAEEKQSWFNLLPMMNKEQIDKLRDILTREKQKLNDFLSRYTSINLPGISRLLDIPLSKARMISFELELDGFLERKENFVKKRFSRYWKLKENVNDVNVKNERGIRGTSECGLPHIECDN